MYAGEEIGKRLLGYALAFVILTALLYAAVAQPFGASMTRAYYEQHAEEVDENLP